MTRRTIERLSAVCELGWHAHCSGRGLGNDASTAIGNSAGDVVGVACTCECHRVQEREATHEESCAGCYEVEPGVRIHPPKSWRRA